MLQDLNQDKRYGGDDFAEDYQTVGPQVYPGPDYKHYKTVYETIYETTHPYPYESAHSHTPTTIPSLN